jgi:hypothetical protein
MIEPGTQAPDFEFAKVAYLVAALVGLGFGGADQYLGSLVSLGSWSHAVSGMSAPWLLLPFAFGATQRHRRHAMLLGLVATVSALTGYFALTLSPLESVPLSHFPADLAALARSNLLNIVGGLVTGPSFGLLGYRWRATRSLSAAALVAAAFCLEPFARLAVGQLAWPTIVWGIEVAAGACLAGCFVLARTTHRRGIAT